MEKKKKQAKVHLTMDKEFYDVLLEEAEKNYLKPTAFILQTLKKSILGDRK